METVTFLFLDIEGSTRLLHLLGNRYADVLADYRRLVRGIVRDRGGTEIGTAGDSIFNVFANAAAAVAAALGAQRAIVAHAWPEGASVRVRMGLHTGEPHVVGGEYVGLDVHRAARVCSAGQGGQILLSQTTHDLAARGLPPGATVRDLGGHRLKDLQRPERIFKLLHPDLPRDVPRLNSLDALRHNLPIHLTSFIGRDREMAEVKRLLAAARLVTLTGVGGCGKTRLACQVAADMPDQFPDGVWLVELAPLSDPALIPQALTSALGVREEPQRPLTDTVVDYLRSTQTLLVMDNCEHLVAASAHLSERLLQACAGLRILATSREPLGIAGEVAWTVPSLASPNPQQLPPVENLAQYPAIRLFIERAVAALPTFRVTPSHAATVAKICARLDGLPLAIELAAARVKVLSVDQIASRLDDRFRLLTGGSRTALPRQQTLQAAMDWSYELLSDRERAALRRLSVFAGGWSLEGAEAVGAGGGISKPEILRLLGQLVDKSLVNVEDQEPEVRYGLLDTVRQYGLRKLLEAGEAQGTRASHLAWCIELAEHAADHGVHGPDQRLWLARLEAEHDNLRAAMAWAREGGDTEAALRLARGLWWFWYLRGHFGEGCERSEAALGGPGGAPARVRAEVLAGAGLLAWAQGDYLRAVALCDEGLAVSRTADDKIGIAYALVVLGMVAHRQGDFDRAEALYGEALAAARDLGNHWIRPVILLFLGRVRFHWKDYDRAEALFTEGLALSRSTGDVWCIASYLLQSGLVARRQGDVAAAQALLEEGLVLFRDLGSTQDVAFSLNMLGRIAYDRGDYARAEPLHTDALALSRKMGDTWISAYSLYHSANAARRQANFDRSAALYRESLGLQNALQDRQGIFACLVGLARVAVLRGHLERAARLMGVVEALREGGEPSVVPFEGDAYDRDVFAARDGLGETAFAALFDEGRTLTLEQAVAVASEPELPRAS